MLLLLAIVHHLLVSSLHPAVAIAFCDTSIQVRRIRAVCRSCRAAHVNGSADHEGEKKD